MDELARVAAVVARLRAENARLAAERDRWMRKAEDNEDACGELRAEIHHAALERDAVAEAVEWCRAHGADVAFDHCPGERPTVRVSVLDSDKDDWADSFAPTFVAAVAAARAASKESQDEG